jgi:hypothetical protein
MMIAALQDEGEPYDENSNSNRLLDASKRLCIAFYDFLKYVEPECAEVIYLLFLVLISKIKLA